MNEFDKAYLNYLDYRDSSNNYMLDANGYRLENNTKTPFFGKLQKYNQDIGTGMLRGGAKLTEGVLSLLAAGTEKFILGPEAMKKLDPEGDGIVNEIGEYFATEVYPKIGDTETLAGGFAEGLTQYLTPGVGYYKLFNGLIKAKGVIPFVAKALSAEAATVGTAQVPGDPNFVGFVSQLMNIDTNKADNIVKATFNYLATPEDVEGGYDADAVFEEKMKAIIADAPLGPVGEAIVPFFTGTMKGMKKLFKDKPKEIESIQKQTQEVTSYGYR